MDFFEFIVNDLPLSINNALEIVNIANSDFSIFFFGLEFKLNLQDDDFRVGEALGLLLKTGIRECLFECDTAHKERIIDGSACDFLDTDKVLVEKVGIEFFNSRNNNFSEEVLVTWEKLWIKSSLSALDEHASSLFSRIYDLNDETVEVLEAELKSLLVSSDDDLRVHAIFDEAFGIFEELSCKNGDCGGAA